MKKLFPRSYQFILASASPRRKILLKKAGYRFKIVPSHVSENHSNHLKPAALVKMLALKKAISISKRFPNEIVLGADTLVYVNQHLIGKPRSLKHAQRILQELSGAWQRVYTGVAVVWDGGKGKRCSAAVSYVKFRTLKREEIEQVSKKHLDKAGAYSIQEKGDDFVECLHGDYDNVVGLPIKLVKKLLRGAGV